MVVIVVAAPFLQASSLWHINTLSSVAFPSNFLSQTILLLLQFYTQPILCTISLPATTINSTIMSTSSFFYELSSVSKISTGNTNDFLDNHFYHGDSVHEHSCTCNCCVQARKEAADKAAAAMAAQLLQKKKEEEAKNAAVQAKAKLEAEIEAKVKKDIAAKHGYCCYNSYEISLLTNTCHCGGCHHHH